MSEVDANDVVLATLTDVMVPKYLSLVSEDHLLVADGGRDDIPLLNGRLQLE